ncbi:M56 family metallopeptidase, partial [Paenibacillus macquariensis]
MNRITEHLINLFDCVWSVSIMASILVLLIMMMQHVLKHRLKPRWHYLMWLLVIVRLIVPWGPESEFSIYNWIGYTDSVHSVVQVTQEEILAKTVIPAEAATHSIYRILMVIWMIGMCLLGIYTIWINRNFAKKMRQESVTITDVRVLELFYQCKKLMSINKPIALIKSSNLATPTLFGFMKPQLIMPHTILNSLNDDELQHVFLHELAHNKRNDIAFNWFMHVLLIIHWFNPVLWYGYHRMREDQEIASDALALSYLTPDRSQHYGYTLIKLLENFSQPVRVAGNVNLTGSKTQLQRRIKMIKQYKANSYRMSFLGLVTLIFISGCALTNPKVSQTPIQLPSTVTSEENFTVASLDVQQPTVSNEKSNVDSSVDPQPTVAKEKPSASSDGAQVVSPS